MYAISDAIDSAWQQKPAERISIFIAFTVSLSSWAGNTGISKTGIPDHWPFFGGINTGTESVNIAAFDISEPLSKRESATPHFKLAVTQFYCKSVTRRAPSDAAAVAVLHVPYCHLACVGGQPAESSELLSRHPGHIQPPPDISESCFVDRQR